ncbi:DUF6313 family protein [Streptomyces qinglanensis]|uniref:Uncharacterized protein n=1 Tax=Streptomyces qinglanensis TaxID=943816 RepID=A0A1H9WRY5_9ACTN|nr:hypothetical protein SAMN05421870_12039 [Streptomyces qinglanensis]
MRTLSELHAEGGEARIFANMFVTPLHGGDWGTAKDHWTRTVEHVANNVKELEAMPVAEAARTAENLARSLCSNLATVGRCWACAYALR